MQKKIIALAIAAAFAAPVAMAETANVNVYGSIDAGLRSDTSPGITSNQFGSGTYNSNRWGIKSSEDLGDGMKANFGLEGGFNTGTGASGATLFDRNATVGVSGDFGKVDLGRQYSVAFKTIGDYDPFGYKYISIAYAAAAAQVVRFDNDISYTGQFGAVKVMAEHNMGTSGYDAATTNAVGVSYAAAGFNVGGAYSATKAPVSAAGLPSTIPSATNGEVKYFTLGAGYNFGDGKVSVGYSKKATSGDSFTVLGTTYAVSDAEDKFIWLGGSYNVTSKVGVTAAIYKRTQTPVGVPSLAPIYDANSTRMMVGATYSLSKRTNFYAELDKTTTSSTAPASSDVDFSGYSLGLATTF